MWSIGMTTVLIELANIRKSYGGQDGTPAVEVLHSIDLSIEIGRASCRERV